jgi:predicted DNA-binding transcriptional regulator AlpA
MLKIIRDLLKKIIDDIDAGNSNIKEDEAIEVVKIIKSYTDKTQRLSKYQACQKLNVSRATFDNYVREGIIPRGEKVAGFKELSWSKKDLDDCIKKANTP